MLLSHPAPRSHAAGASLSAGSRRAARSAALARPNIAHTTTRYTSYATVEVAKIRGAMSLFKPTPEELERKEQRRQEEKRQAAAAEAVRQEKEFLKTPPGRARAARKSGMKIFQIDMPLSQSKAHIEPMIGAFTRKENTADYANMIQAIEEEGWRLEDVGYVFRWTGSETRDKFFASGQQESVSGEIIGIYIFRATEAA